MAIELTPEHVKLTLHALGEKKARNEDRKIKNDKRRYHDTALDKENKEISEIMGILMNEYRSKTFGNIPTS